MPQPVASAALLAASGLTPVDAGSPNAERTTDIFWFISFFAALVLLSVVVPLVVFTVRYRSRGRPREEEGPQIRGNTNLEIAWTLAPIVILVLISAFAFYKLPGITLEAEAEASELTIQVDGRQFYWEYHYPNGAIAIDRLVAPADRVVELRITAPESDVNHSYWVPGLGGKFDAIPGETTETAFQAKPGTYEGQCAEFCGLQHAAMLAEIEVMPAAEFDSWVRQQAEAQAAGESDLGEQEFAGVCAKCHGEQGEGLIGPGFTATTVANAESVAQIVREGRNEMPAVGAGWSDEQMEALTSYLRERFGEEGQSGSEG